MLDWGRIRKAAVTVVIRPAGSSDARRHERASPPRSGTRVANRRKQRPAVWVLLLLVFMTGSAAALFARGGHVERRNLEARRNAANIDLDRQLLKVHGLRREVELLQRDSLARERLAREELGYTKRGEMIFLLAEPSKTAKEGDP